ncbi:serine carboxypeptidase [Russula brevipes]|nr:serine carboxypeptidase [Russula brevipes]
MLLLRSTLVTILALPVLIGGYQVPTVDGVIGGIPSGDTRQPKTLKEAASIDATTPTPGKLRVVENSGVCETTPRVYQASGYGDLSSNQSIWFWFFAARNNPATAPLITWFNGGPGSSSMIGLFQELGPCRINNQSSGVDLNPTSWNTNANVLFIDQPVGVGFSYGSMTVGTSRQAAVDVWKFLQIWFADSRFSKYASRDSESGPNHMADTTGPHLPLSADRYFLDQNAAIANRRVVGTRINLKVLGIGNGLTDPLSQYPGYIQYAQSNPYHPLVDTSVISSADTAWTQANGCRDQIRACNNGGSNAVCSAAQSFCNSFILSPLEGVWDVYYVPTARPDPYPPAVDPYLTRQAVTSSIGAQSTWQMTNFLVYNNFAATGDGCKVINAGVRTVIYAGDADYIVNYIGVEAMVASLRTRFSTQFAQQRFANFTVKGALAGLYKNAGTFSYLRVIGAGHEVPAYLWRGVPRGTAALQMFTQIMSGQQLSGT